MAFCPLCPRFFMCGGIRYPLRRRQATDQDHKPNGLPVSMGIGWRSYLCHQCNCILREIENQRIKRSTLRSLGGGQRYFNYIDRWNKITLIQNRDKGIPQLIEGPAELDPTCLPSINITATSPIPKTMEPSQDSSSQDTSIGTDTPGTLVGQSASGGEDNAATECKAMQS